MSNDYLEWLSVNQMPKLRTLFLEHGLSRNDLVTFLSKHDQKVYKTELTEDILQRINRSFVFDYVESVIGKLKPINLCKNEKKGKNYCKACKQTFPACFIEKNGKKCEQCLDYFRGPAHVCVDETVDCVFDADGMK